MDYEILGGLPYPLGANYDGNGVNFALFSAHATRVQLCLFNVTEKKETGCNCCSHDDTPDMSGMY